MNKPLLNLVEIWVLVLGVSLWLFRCLLILCVTWCSAVLKLSIGVYTSAFGKYVCCISFIFFKIFFQVFVIFLKNNKHLTNDQKCACTVCRNKLWTLLLKCTENNMDKCSAIYMISLSRPRTYQHQINNELWLNTTQLRRSMLMPL